MREVPERVILDPVRSFLGVAICTHAIFASRPGGKEGGTAKIYTLVEIAIFSFKKQRWKVARQRIENEHYHMIILKNGPKSQLRMLKQNNSRMISAAVWIAVWTSWDQRGMSHE